MATIYYLNWDKEQRSRETPELDPASELFHKITVSDVLDEEEKPGTSYTEDEFDELYREIAEVDVDDPEQLWKEWNRGSGYETREFLGLEERSMSVGDVVEIDGTYHQAQSIGWKQITVNNDRKAGKE